MHLKLNERKVDGVMVLDLSGRLLLGDETSALREALNDTFGRGEKHVLLNLAGLRYMDSSGLNTFIRGLTDAVAAGARIKLVHLDNRVHDLIRVTHLHTKFEVFNDETAAIHSFAKERS